MSKKFEEDENNGKLFCKKCKSYNVKTSGVSGYDRTGLVELERRECHNCGEIEYD